MTNHQNQQDKPSTTTKSSINNNIIINSAHAARRVLTHEDGERIVAAYVANVNERGMTMAVARIIEDAVKAGLTVDDIVDACEATGLAPYPSPRYLKAVLRNWSTNGRVADHARHDAAQTNPWWKPAKNPAFNYAQREYIDSDFDASFFVDLDKYAEE